VRSSLDHLATIMRNYEKGQERQNNQIRPSYRDKSTSNNETLYFIDRSRNVGEGETGEKDMTYRHIEVHRVCEFLTRREESVADSQTEKKKPRESVFLQNRGQGDILGGVKKSQRASRS